MNLPDIIEQLTTFAQTHDYDEDFDEFDLLCNKIMSDKQTYFQWQVDGDCFSIDDALDTVMGCISDAQQEGKQIKDYTTCYVFDDDRLFLFVEYK